MKTQLASLLVLVGAAAARVAYADDKAAAEAAFLEAKALAKDGKWVEACPKFELSYRADPQLGALLNVADCYARIGRTATAWAEFHEAEELAAKKGDAREKYAHDRAAAIEPLLDKLRIDPPAVPVAGLVVRRDGADVTAVLGTALPLDPGDHEIVASAPGAVDWKTTVTIAGEGTTANVTVAALEKRIEAPAIGKLVVATRGDAAISIDGNAVGTGRFEGDLSPGGHTLRVVAPGMRVYQSEIVVARDTTRTIDVPLEPELAVIAVAPPLVEIDRYDGPGGEVDVSSAIGVKLHGDRPPVLAYRVEISRRSSWHVGYGAFAELGSIDASNACGSDMAGAAAGSSFDFGAHNQFTKCAYVLAGLQLYVHILPHGRFDPYVAIAPGFRATFVNYIPFGPTGMPGATQSDTWPAIVVGARAGVDYRPLVGHAEWKVGALVETQVTVFGEEEINGKGATYASLFGGLRSSYAF